MSIPPLMLCVNLENSILGNFQQLSEELQVKYIVRLELYTTGDVHRNSQYTTKEKTQPTTKTTGKEEGRKADDYYTARAYNDSPRSCRLKIPEPPYNP